MTVGDMLDRMTGAEFLMWRAHFELTHREQEKAAREADRKRRR